MASQAAPSIQANHSLSFDPSPSASFYHSVSDPNLEAAASSVHCVVLAFFYLLLPPASCCFGRILPSWLKLKQKRSLFPFCIFVLSCLFSFCLQLRCSSASSTSHLPHRLSRCRDSFLTTLPSPPPSHDLSSQKAYPCFCDSSRLHLLLLFLTSSPQFSHIMADAQSASDIQATVLGGAKKGPDSQSVTKR